MADAKSFRKKPVIIQAIQWDGTLSGIDDILSVFTDIRTVAKTSHPPTNKCSYWKIETLEGGHEVSAGDFIIRGVKGEYYPCKPDIFAMTYEPATATPPADAALAALLRNLEIQSTNNHVAKDKRTASADYCEGIAKGFDECLRIVNQHAAALRARAVPEGKKYHDVAQRLYALLDDIDTAGDIAKSDDKLYRGIVERTQAKKRDFVVSCDGYTVTLADDSMLTASKEAK